MLFSGIPFLYYFLPAVLLLYFAVPKSIKNFVLLVASLFFYAWGEPKIVMIMIASILVGYISGLLIEAFRHLKVAKAAMILSVLIQIGCLVYYKYMDFFIENINRGFGMQIPLLRIALPVGISFYTFQILSYTVDVYRGEKAQRNPINLAAYIAMFPQLIAGPIVRYKDVAPQLEVKGAWQLRWKQGKCVREKAEEGRSITSEDIAYGIRRFVLGLGKKVLIANQLGELCDLFRGFQDKTVVFYWVYAIAFSLHVYFDFSGYSDMAIGLGRIFGFRFLENFNYPFISGSVTEFWRRWHISLGSWFRDYVYIPLGGNRVPKWRWYFNILVVWMLTGFWHGAAWNFVVWGLYFALLLVLEKQFLLKIFEKYKVIGHVYVIPVIVISFVIFNATDMREAIQYIGGMFGFGGVSLVSEETIYYLRNYGIVLLAALVGATPIVKKLCGAVMEKKWCQKAIFVLEPVVFVTLLLVITAYLVDGSFNPFLYFRF